MEEREVGLYGHIDQDIALYFGEWGFDYIKIDGELMHALMTDTSVQHDVEVIVKAAAKREIKTIAERVENANAMAVLFQLGLDYMQGHYVHEPEVVLQDAPEGKPTSLAELAAANGN